MAISFREFPWYIQALIFVALAVVLIGLGIFLPFSPVASKRAEVAQLHVQDAQLNQDVSSLEVYERRYAEFNQEMNALHKQLDTLQAIVPEDKQTDEFIRLLQGAAAASGVQVRSLIAQAVVPHQYHYEMPFAISVDGPYFNVVDFFSRLSRLSRIINVGDLSLGAVDPAKGKYPMRAGTSVSGNCIVVTFFTSPEAPAAAPPSNAAPAANHPGPAVPNPPKTAPPKPGAVVN
jgi:type IV pilus assembly protein PilO